ncbi:hypothetical protein MTR_3g081080 [Medicago truncatula]|uniref:Uncharacterized protein n=1 Tax=Medicago truncatula TaxID=3880 RepID=A0A072V008_MEDTR|nr:hypothetical protein MTR_3g081080 [Medicago truncatula]
MYIPTATIILPLNEIKTLKYNNLGLIEKESDPRLENNFDIKFGQSSPRELTEMVKFVCKEGDD